MLLLALSIGLTILYAAACLGAGSLFRRLLTFRAGPRSAAPAGVDVTTDFLLGQGLLANIWLVLALAYALSPPVVWLIILCSLGCMWFAWPGLRAALRGLRPSLRSLRDEGLPWVGIVGLIALILALLAVGALVLAPRGDSAAFYMVLPKVVAASHRLTELRGLESLMQLGLFGEMHHAALMLIGNDRAAKLFVWSNSLSVAVMFFALCARVGLGRKGRLIALAVLFTSTALIFIIPDGKADLFAAALAMAALYWAMVSGEEARPSSALRLAGLLAGFAVIAKISYFVPLIAGVVLLVVWPRLLPAEGEAKAGRFSRILVVLARLGFWMALPAVTHVIKNSVLFGEPLAPLMVHNPGLGGVFQAWFTPDVTRWIVLTYPLALVFGEYPIQGGTLSALILVFAPLVFVLARPASFARSRLVRVTTVAVTGAVLWVIFRPSILAPRYLLSVLLLIIPLVARGAERAAQLERRPRLLSAGVLASTVLALVLALAVTLSYLSLTPGKVLRYAAGRLPECEVTGAECPSLSLINREAQPGERVYVATHFIYSLRPDLLECIPDTPEKDTLTETLGAPEERWAYLYERGFRYVVIDETTHAAVAAALDTSRAPAWLRVVAVSSDNNFKVFRLDPLDASRQPKVTCRQVNPPAWDVVAR